MRLATLSSKSVMSANKIGTGSEKKNGKKILKLMK